MSQLFSAFGLDWRLLLINLLNFGLLLWLLRRYAYGPLTKMLSDRRTLIQTGVANAAAAEAQLKEVVDARSTMLAEAGKEADTILSNARLGGAEKERTLVAQGEQAAAALLVQAQKSRRSKSPSSPGK